MTSPHWEPFRIEEMSIDVGAMSPRRTNHFGICWIQSGQGNVSLDGAQFPIGANELLFLTPYQYVRIECSKRMLLHRVLFHANFLCIETFHAETGCSGPLFSDPYRLPLVTLNRKTTAVVKAIYQNLALELKQKELGYLEALLAHTKLLLIQSARWKGITQSERTTANEFRNPVLGPLKDLIEQNYRHLHSPSDYAERLHMTTKSLGRCVREQLGKTLTELIRQRILTHAKWELLHTLRPVKEIAAEVGFQDELYFSRLFKKATGLSPTAFREYETEIRGGSNLSMTSSPTSIRATMISPDDARR